MTDPLNQAGRDLLFREARTHNGWLDRAVSEDTLRELYDLMKWGPTSANSTPMRVVFLRSKTSKERLRPALMEMNIDKTMGAPVTAIVAYDLKFYEKLPKLFPHNQHIRGYFAGMPDLVDSTAQRNSALQGAYFIIAARAVGLDCGPMQGFDSVKVDTEFFGKAAIGNAFPEGDVRTNFLLNLGYGDHSKLFPRSPRLDFDEACVLL
jgi:3-hydroxypropanoate dehydrogenase